MEKTPHSDTHTSLHVSRRAQRFLRLCVGAARSALTFLVRLLASVPAVRSASRRVMLPADENLAMRAFGNVLASPVGLASGFDRDGTGYETFEALGMGFVEVGPFAIQAQDDEPLSRILRLAQKPAPKPQSDGSHAPAVAFCAPSARKVPIGMNLDLPKRLSERRVAHYLRKTQQLSEVCDYLVVSVPSPKRMQVLDVGALEHLTRFLAAVRRTLDDSSSVFPTRLLVKLPPDLTLADVDAIADIAMTLRLDGVVAAHDHREVDSRATAEQRKQCSVAMIRHLRQRTEGRLMLVGVGGIESAEDALDLILAGATVVQVCGEFVQGGALRLARLQRDLSRLLRERGYARVVDAIGAEVALERPPSLARLSVRPPAPLESAVVDDDGTGESPRDASQRRLRRRPVLPTSDLAPDADATEHQATGTDGKGQPVGSKAEPPIHRVP